MRADPTRRTHPGRRRTVAERGTALVEVLGALLLFATAGAIVAQAITVNLRLATGAATRGRLVALAAEEMARLQVTRTPGSERRPLADDTLRGYAQRTTTPDDDGLLATLTVDATGPTSSTRLTTRVLLPW